MNKENTPYLLVSGDLVSTGGMDQANLALALYLAHCGYELHVVAHRVDAELAAHPNVFVHRVPKPLNSYLLGGRLLRRAGRTWGARIGARSGRVIVNGGNCDYPDVNWVHYVHAAYVPQVEGGALQVLKSHWKHRAFLQEEGSALSRTRLILANSERTRRDLVEHFGIPSKLIQRVYYGTDRERFHPVTSGERANAAQQLSWPSGRPYVAFVGAPDDRRKGFDTLFKAWLSLCSDATWDANLVVMGRCTGLPSWRARAEACGIANRILFLGFREDVHQVLAACSCLAAPTRYEAFGLGVQESLCCGLPAIVSEGSGVAEIYPEALRPLLLPDPDNADDLAARLRLWHSHADHFRAAAVSFSEQLLTYTWDHMAARIVSLMEENRP